MKLIKILLFSSVLGMLFTVKTFADTCPSPSQIKQGQLNGWLIYVGKIGAGYSLASPKIIKNFEQSQEIEPANANWSNWGNTPNNSWCQYGGTIIPPDNSIIALFKTEEEPSGAEWSTEGAKNYMTQNQTTISCMMHGGVNSCPYP